MKQIVPIMTEEEFTVYLDKLEKSVEEGLENRQDYNTIRCRLMGYLEREETYAFTGEQLQRAFDLGFCVGERDVK